MIPLQKPGTDQSCFNPTRAQHLHPTKLKSGSAFNENPFFPPAFSCSYSVAHETICLTICTIFIFYKAPLLSVGWSSSLSFSEANVNHHIKGKESHHGSLQAAVHRLCQAEQQRGFSTALPLIFFPNKARTQRVD